MVNANRRGWYGERKRHALAAKGMKTASQKTRTVNIENIDYTPEVKAYEIYDPETDELITTIDIESLKDPLIQEKVDLALPPEQYKWKPIY